MDWTTLAAGPAGAALGFVGSLVQKGLGIWEAGRNHRMKLEELEVMSKIDLQKADVIFRTTVEEKSGEAFRAAIEAQAAVSPAHPWAKTFLALFRPGLTLYLMVAATVIALWRQTSQPELIEFIVVSMFSMSSTAIGFWFGARTDDKFKVTQAFPAPRK